MALLKWALIMAILSIFAGIFGFTGLSIGFAEIARFLFYLFVVVFVVLLVLGLSLFRKLT